MRQMNCWTTDSMRDLKEVWHERIVFWLPCATADVILECGDHNINDKLAKWYLYVQHDEGQGLPNVRENKKNVSSIVWPSLADNRLDFLFRFDSVFASVPPTAGFADISWKMCLSNYNIKNYRDSITNTKESKVYFKQLFVLMSANLDDHDIDIEGGNGQEY